MCIVRFRRRWAMPMNVQFAFPFRFDVVDDVVQIWSNEKARRKGKMWDVQSQKPEAARQQIGAAARTTQNKLA